MIDIDDAPQQPVPPGFQQPDYPKSECPTDPRDEKISRLRRQLGDWLNATADARLQRDELRKLCVAAHEFLTSPALASLRIGDRRVTREELIETLSMVEPPQ